MGSFRAVKLNGYVHNQLKVLAAKEKTTMQELTEEALAKVYGIEILPDMEEVAHRVVKGIEE